MTLSKCAPMGKAIRKALFGLPRAFSRSDLEQIGKHLLHRTEPKLSGGAVISSSGDLGPGLALYFHTWEPESQPKEDAGAGGQGK